MSSSGNREIQVWTDLGPTGDMRLSLKTAPEGQFCCFRLLIESFLDKESWPAGSNDNS